MEEELQPLPDTVDDYSGTYDNLESLGKDPQHGRLVSPISTFPQPGIFATAPAESDPNLGAVPIAYDESDDDRPVAISSSKRPFKSVNFAIEDDIVLDNAPPLSPSPIKQSILGEDVPPVSQQQHQALADASYIAVDGSYLDDVRQASEQFGAQDYALGEASHLAVDGSRVFEEEEDTEEPAAASSAVAVLEEDSQLDKATPIVAVDDSMIVPLVDSPVEEEGHQLNTSDISSIAPRDEDHGVDHFLDHSRDVNVLNEEADDHYSETEPDLLISTKASEESRRDGSDPVKSTLPISSPQIDARTDLPIPSSDSQANGKQQDKVPELVQSSTMSPTRSPSKDVREDKNESEMTPMKRNVGEPSLSVKSSSTGGVDAKASVNKTDAMVESEEIHPRTVASHSLKPSPKKSSPSTPVTNQTPVHSASTNAVHDVHAEKEVVGIPSLRKSSKSSQHAAPSSGSAKKADRHDTQKSSSSPHPVSASADDKVTTITNQSDAEKKVPDIVSEKKETVSIRSPERFEPLQSKSPSLGNKDHPDESSVIKATSAVIVDPNVSAVSQSEAVISSLPASPQKEINRSTSNDSQVQQDMSAYLHPDHYFYAKTEEDQAEEFFYDSQANRKSLLMRSGSRAGSMAMFAPLIQQGQPQLQQLQTPVNQSNRQMNGSTSASPVVSAKVTTPVPPSVSALSKVFAEVDSDLSDASYDAYDRAHQVASVIEHSAGKTKKTTTITTSSSKKTSPAHTDRDEQYKEYAVMFDDQQLVDRVTDAPFSLRQDSRPSRRYSLDELSQAVGSLHSDSQVAQEYLYYQSLLAKVEATKVQSDDYEALFNDDDGQVASAYEQEHEMENNGIYNEAYHKPEDPASERSVADAPSSPGIAQQFPPLSAHKRHFRSVLAADYTDQQDVNDNQTGDEALHQPHISMSDGANLSALSSSPAKSVSSNKSPSPLKTSPSVSNPIQRGKKAKTRNVVSKREPQPPQEIPATILDLSAWEISNLTRLDLSNCQLYDANMLFAPSFAARHAALTETPKNVSRRSGLPGPPWHHLQILCLQNNAIESIDVPLPPSLIYLDLSNNCIQQVSALRTLSLGQRLQYLDLSGNPVAIETTNGAALRGLVSHLTMHQCTLSLSSSSTAVSLPPDSASSAVDFTSYAVLQFLSTNHLPRLRYWRSLGMPKSTAAPVSAASRTLSLRSLSVAAAKITPPAPGGTLSELQEMKAQISQDIQQRLDTEALEKRRGGRTPKPVGYTAAQKEQDAKRFQYHKLQEEERRRTQREVEQSMQDSMLVHASKVLTTKDVSSLVQRLYHDRLRDQERQRQLDERNRQAEELKKQAEFEASRQKIKADRERAATLSRRASQRSLSATSPSGYSVFSWRTEDVSQRSISGRHFHVDDDEEEAEESDEEGSVEYVLEDQAAAGMPPHQTLSPISEDADGRVGRKKGSAKSNDRRQEERRPRENVSPHVRTLRRLASSGGTLKLDNLFDDNFSTHNPDSPSSVASSTTSRHSKGSSVSAGSRQPGGRRSVANLKHMGSLYPVTIQTGDVAQVSSPPQPQQSPLSRSGSMKKKASLRSMNIPTSPAMQAVLPRRNLGAEFDIVEALLQEHGPVSPRIPTASSVQMAVSPRSPAISIKPSHRWRTHIQTQHQRAHQQYLEETIIQRQLQLNEEQRQVAERQAILTHHKSQHQLLQQQQSPIRQGSARNLKSPKSVGTGSRSSSFRRQPTGLEMDFVLKLPSKEQLRQQRQQRQRDRSEDPDDLHDAAMRTAVDLQTHTTEEEEEEEEEERDGVDMDEEAREEMEYRKGRGGSQSHAAMLRDGPNSAVTDAAGDISITNDDEGAEDADSLDKPDTVSASDVHVWHRQTKQKLDRCAILLHMLMDLAQQQQSAGDDDNHNQNSNNSSNSRGLLLESTYRSICEEWQDLGFFVDDGEDDGEEDSDRGSRFCSHLTPPEFIEDPEQYWPQTTTQALPSVDEALELWNVLIDYHGLFSQLQSALQVVSQQQQPQVQGLKGVELGPVLRRLLQTARGRRLQVRLDGRSIDM